MRYLTNILTLVFLVFSCNTMEIPKQDEEEQSGELEGTVIVDEVQFNGTEGNYTFSVTLSSPDTGCEQYADWWEVVGEDGKLLYRRVLGHSHVNEQPFLRSGGPIEISEEAIVVVRAHMNNSGYGINGMMGSIKDGFEKFDIEKDFAKNLENDAPQPPKCAF